MRSEANTPSEYLASLPAGRRETIEELRRIILDNLPEGFEETMQYGMLAYVVPHAIYPAGYHVNPEVPLPFMALASQKNNISLYHNSLYSDAELMAWFKEEYGKRLSKKLDMGKSCIRFRKPKDIPFDLIAELCRKMSVDDWIKLYRSSLKKGGKK